MISNRKTAYLCVCCKEVNPATPFPFDFSLDMADDILFREKLDKPFLENVPALRAPTENIVRRTGVVDCGLRANSPQPMGGEFFQVSKYCRRFVRKW